MASRSDEFQRAPEHPDISLPSGWRWKLLGHAIKLRRDVVVLKDDMEYLRVTVQLHGRGIKLRDRVHGRDVKTKKQYLTRKNDLLVAEIDAKMGAFGIVPPELDGGIVSSHYFSFAVDSALILPEFLSLFVRVGYFTARISEFVRGSLNYAAIRPRHVESIPIPIPSLRVQGEVAEQLTIADAVTANLREQLAIAEKLPFSIVRHALSGAELNRPFPD